jgi:hypothetical protein
MTKYRTAQEAIDAGDPDAIALREELMAMDTKDLTGVAARLGARPPFEWKNLLPWRRCEWCHRLWFGWGWAWCRWGWPWYCSQKCENDEIDQMWSEP